MPGKESSATPRMNRPPVWASTCFGTKFEIGTNFGMAHLGRTRVSPRGPLGPGTSGPVDHLAYAQHWQLILLSLENVFTVPAVPSKP